MVDSDWFLLDLPAFPNEIILCIASNLEVPDLNALLQANHRLCTLLTPSLTRVMVQRKDDLLIWAAYIGNEPLARRLLNEGANPTHRDVHKLDALYMAAKYGRVEIMTMLLDAGARVDAVCGELGRTALFIAAEYGHEAAVRVLLEEGADVNFEDAVGVSVVDAAISSRCRFSQEAVFELLLDSGLNTTTQDRVLRGSRMRLRGRDVNELRESPQLQWDARIIELLEDRGVQYFQPGDDIFW